ncbi:hypothetical protein D3C87_905800 [compost metagenome]
MKKMIIAAAVALGMSGAFAAQTNTGCQGNCPSTGGDTINNTTNQGGTGYGGNGGNGFGGAGGTGVGVGLGGAGGQGGAVVGSGNSTSHATGGSVVGSGNSAATGGSVKNAGNSKNTNRNNNRNDNNSNATSYGSVATTAQSTSLTVEGDTTNYHAPRIPVSTAYALNIMPTASCMGSSSVGAQGVGFGVSMGTSWTDTNCQMLEQIRTVAVVLGQKEVAQEMMMAVPAYADAVKRLQDKKAGVTKAEVVREAPVYTKTKFDLLGN